MRTRTKIILLGIIAALTFLSSVLAAYFVYNIDHDILDTIAIFICVNLFTMFAMVEMVRVRQMHNEDDWYNQWLEEQFKPTEFKPAVRMSKERYNAIMAGREQLTQQDIENGYHFCPDWDGLLIHRTDLEYKHCTCNG